MVELNNKHQAEEYQNYLPEGFVYKRCREMY